MKEKTNNHAEFLFVTSLEANTEEPWYNKGPRDRKNMFAIARFHHIEVLFHIFYYYWGRDKSFVILRFSWYSILLCRGSIVILCKSSTRKVQLDVNTIAFQPQRSHHERICKSVVVRYLLVICHQLIIYYFQNVHCNSLSLNLIFGGSMAEWLEWWTCNPEAPSSSPALTANRICSW